MDLVCTLAACLVLVPGRPPDTGITMNDFMREWEARERVVRSRLHEETLWSDPARKGDLLQCLQAAGALRAESLAPVLAAHLTYKPRGDAEERRLTIEARFPVFAALTQIGVPAVPAVLDRLKSADREDRLGTGQQAHNLAVLCLIAIYDQGGYGRALARQRIELESQAATGREKDFLLRALEHPQLRDRS
jgi:hypothetical protein